MAEKEISNIKELVEALDNLGEPEEGYTRFFRGHSCHTYELIPSIYREDYLIRNEDNIIRDALVSSPDSFSADETLFEKLVKLQHYGYKTRLLDLTSNILVGLYFACSPSDQDGELIVLDIPNSAIKYDDSDTVAILSALSLRDYKFDIYNFIKSSKIHANLEKKKIEEDEYLSSITSEDVVNLMRMGGYDEDSFPSKEDIRKLINTIIEDKYQEEFINKFNGYLEIKRLLNDIQKDKIYFSPRINPDDLSRVICVKAKMNNSRIIHQQGSFLLFGINERKMNCAVLNGSWQKSSKDSKNRILIKNNAKENILKQLKTFGISREFLFPELESQAQAITERYKN